MTRFFPAFAFFTGLVCASSACAQWQYSLDAGARLANVTETGLDGRTLVRERGWLPGIGAGANYRMQEWRFGAAAEVFDAAIDYDGQLQSGQPFDSKTDTTHYRLRLEAGRQVGEATELVAALEHDGWRRAIRGRGEVIGLRERYTSWRVLTGARTRIARWAAGRLDGSALFVISTPERVRVRFGQDLFDDARLRTGVAAGLRLGLAFHPSALPALSLEAGLDWIDIDRSRNVVVTRNGIPAGSIAQPRHDRVALDARVRYRF